MTIADINTVGWTGITIAVMSILAVAIAAPLLARETMLDHEQIRADREAAERTRADVARIHTGQGTDTGTLLRPHLPPQYRK